MKNFLIQFISILVLSVILQFFFPWWIFVVTAAIISVCFKHQLKSFLAGFLAIGLSWFVAAYYLSSGESGQLLASKMGALFGDLSGFTLVLVTALLGALLGGLAAWTGTAGRQILE